MLWVQPKQQQQQQQQQQNKQKKNKTKLGSVNKMESYIVVKMSKLPIQKKMGMDLKIMLKEAFRRRT